MSALPAGLERYPSATLALALAVSIGLHGALLAVAALLALPHDTPPDLIRVALIGGGGGGAAATSAAPAPPSAAPAAPAAAPRPPAEAHPPRASTSSARTASSLTSPDHPVRVPPAHAVQPEADSVRPEPVEGRSEREPPAADVARVGNGTGDGAGAGRGPGAGTGSGGGTGSGVGRGSGAGAAGDVRARCVSCPEPQYPRLARARGWQGTVDVEIAISADGRVADANVARSSGYAALDDAALEVARRSRFKLAGSEHDARVHMAYGFRLTAP